MGVKEEPTIKYKPLDVRDFLDLKRPKKMTFGLEVEMFLAWKRKDRINIVADYREEDGSRSADSMPIEFIIAKTDNKRYAERVYMDFYCNQLELRTNPTETPLKMMRELKSTYDHVQKIIDTFNESLYKRLRNDLIALPTSVMADMNTTCGTHLHIRPKNMFNTFVNSYPLLIPFMENSQSCPMNSNVISFRQSQEHHISDNSIGFADDNPKSRSRFNTMRNRNCDIIINKNKKSCMTDRHRVKSVNTIEYRVFDTNWEFDHMKKMFSLFCEVLRHLKQDKIMRYSKDDLFRTRQEAIHSKHGHNYIFDKPNIEVLKELSEMLGIDINKFSTPIRRGFFQDTHDTPPNEILKMVKW